MITVEVRDHVLFRCPIAVSYIIIITSPPAKTNLYVIISPPPRVLVLSVKKLKCSLQRFKIQDNITTDNCQYNIVNKYYSFSYN